jgi:hypothetical protein
MTALPQPSYQHPPAVAGAASNERPSRDIAATAANLSLRTIMKVVSLRHSSPSCHCRVTAIVTIGVDLIFSLIFSIKWGALAELN